MTTREVIRALYRQVRAPDWAAPNLDGLADVLRDLSWLPPGPVLLVLPELDGLPVAEREMLQSVLRRAVAESVGTARPLRVADPGG